MKIKTKLQLLIMATVALFAMAFSLHIRAKSEAEKLGRQEGFVRQLNFEIFQSNQVRDEYFIYRSERSKLQWRVLDKSISDQLKENLILVTDATEKKELAAIKLLHTAISNLFNQLLTHDSTVNEFDATHKIREMIISQMMGESHRLYQKCVALSVDIEHRAEKQGAYYNQFNLLSFGFLGLIITLFSSLIIKSVTKPLLNLKDGTRIIAEGNLDHRLNMDATDEIGELAFNFDRMTEQLSLITVSRDELLNEIEKRESIQKALEERETTFRAVAELSPMAIYASSGSDQKATYINDAFYKIFGYSIEDVPTVGHWWIKAFPDEKYRQQVIDQWLYNIEQANKNNTDVEALECVCTCTDGSEKIIAWVGKTIGDDFWAFGYDCSERQKTEEEKVKLERQLHQSQKMESIGSLAGGVAHDFNNKLSVILGCAYMANAEDDPVQVKQFLEEIRKAAEQSADLTRQLLAFARKQTIVPKVLDLNDTVSGMLKMLNRLIGEDIHLTWQPAADLWLLKFDPSQVDQILANLCVNAKDAISKNGKITIETGNSSIDEAYCVYHPDALPGEYVRLVVSDNGCGMDNETLNHIFEPFFTTKDTGKGTGLGLATVFGIVKQNHGFINVYSESEIGTTFTIYLPRHEGKSSAHTLKETMAISVPQGQETILLVEDELAILNMATIILSKQGYIILSANSPAEAIRLAQKNADVISLLITDVIMPEMSGKELSHKLQSQFPQLKCLYMSGYTADAISQHGVLDDGIHFIQKPFSLPDLANKVREVLDS